MSNLFDKRYIGIINASTTPSAGVRPTCRGPARRGDDTAGEILIVRAAANEEPDTESRCRVDLPRFSPFFVVPALVGAVCSTLFEVLVHGARATKDRGRSAALGVSQVSLLQEWRRPLDAQGST